VVHGYAAWSLYCADFKNIIMNDAIQASIPFYMKQSVSTKARQAETLPLFSQCY